MQEAGVSSDHLVLDEQKELNKKNLTVPSRSFGVDSEGH